MCVCVYNLYKSIYPLKRDESVRMEKIMSYV